MYMSIVYNIKYNIMWHKDCAVEFLGYYLPKSGLTIHLDICLPLKLNSVVFKKGLIYSYIIF